MDIQPETDPLTELALLTLYDFPRKLDTYIQVLTYAQQAPEPNEQAPLTFNMQIPKGISDRITFGDQQVQYPEEIYHHGLNIDNVKDKFELTLERCQQMIDRIFKKIDELDSNVLVYDDFDIEELRLEEKEAEDELRGEIDKLREVLGQVDGRMQAMELEHFG